MASQTFGKKIPPYGIYFSLMLWGRILDNPAGPVVSLDSKLSTHSAALWLNSTLLHIMHTAVPGTWADERLLSLSITPPILRLERWKPVPDHATQDMAQKTFSDSPHFLLLV